MQFYSIPFESGDPEEEPEEDRVAPEYDEFQEGAAPGRTESEEENDD